jgi:hypothetical protein
MSHTLTKVIRSEHPINVEAHSRAFGSQRGLGTKRSHEVGGLTPGAMGENRFCSILLKYHDGISEDASIGHRSLNSTFSDKRQAYSIWKHRRRKFLYLFFVTSFVLQFDLADRQSSVIPLPKRESESTCGIDLTRSEETQDPGDLRAVSSRGAAQKATPGESCTDSERFDQ